MPVGKGNYISRLQISLVYFISSGTPKANLEILIFLYRIYQKLINNLSDRGRKNGDYLEKT